MGSQQLTQVIYAGEFAVEPRRVWSDSVYLGWLYLPRL